MTEQAITVTGLTKDFDVYGHPRDLAIEVLTGRTRHTTFRALDDVSFSVRRGEVFGIIGLNGAGKSTLLKIITGVLDPTAGDVAIRGKVTAILELGLGFDAEATGRANIYLSGLLYGMGKAEIDAKLESIIEFSGLSEFIDAPVKTYSSGMQARLAFSIATAVDPEILIIDEALAAGDSMFVQKCVRRIAQLCRNESTTVLLVSHGTSLLAQLCHRVMWLEKGRVSRIGEAIAVVQAYDLSTHVGAETKGWIEAVGDKLESSSAAEVGAAAATADPAALEQAISSFTGEDIADRGAAARDDTADLAFRRGPIFIDKVELLGRNMQPTARLTLLEPFAVRVTYRCEGALPDETLGVALAINEKGNLAPVMQWYTQNLLPGETRESYGTASFRFRPEPQGVITMRFPPAPFRAGTYVLSIGLLPNAPGSWSFYEYRHLFYTFTVSDAGAGVGAPILLVPRMTHAALPAPPQPPLPKLPPPRHKTLRQEIEAICTGDPRYPAGWPRHARCPACAGDHLADAFKKYGFQHRECLDCGFVFVDPHPPADVLAKLYAGAYYTGVREHYELPRLEAGLGGTEFSAPFAALEAAIERCTAGRAAGRWLDVGGGLGSYAALIAERKPGWEPLLNEMNPRSVEIAASVLGIETVTGDPEALLAASERFDVVSSVSVLEHIPDPASFLIGYSRLLKPGGVMVTIIPQFTALNSAVSRGSSANVVPPYHLSLFNRRSLETMLRRTRCFERFEIDQAGESAFSLVHHVDFGDMWDVTIPTAEAPVPQGVQLVPYEHATAVALNALARADKEVRPYFADNDGRSYLIAYGWAPGNR